MGEERHLLTVRYGSDEQIQRQVGDRQLAWRSRLCIVSGDTIEIEGGRLRDSRSVSHAEDLEVIIFVQPVACNGFGEAQGDVVL